MNLESHIYNAISDWNDDGDNGDQYGNTFFTQEEVSRMAGQFHEWVKQVTGRELH